MNAQKWHDSQRIQVTLPSGLDVTLQRVSPKTLMMLGKIPKPLLTMIGELTRGGGQTVDTNDWRVLINYFDKLPALCEFMDVIVKAALLDPPLAEVSDNDHITLDELDYDDHEFIFNMVTGEAKAIAPFSVEPDGSDHARRDGAAV